MNLSKKRYPIISSTKSMVIIFLSHPTNAQGLRANYMDTLAGTHSMEECKTSTTFSPMTWRSLSS